MVPQIMEESSNKYPPAIGTIYKNRGRALAWTQYTVIEFEKDAVFALRASDNNYFVRYTYKKLSETETEMQYLEWVSEGEIESPFTQEILQGLKELMETVHDRPY